MRTKSKQYSREVEGTVIQNVLRILCGRNASRRFNVFLNHFRVEIEKNRTRFETFIAHNEWSKELGCCLFNPLRLIFRELFKDIEK